MMVDVFPKIWVVRGKRSFSTVAPLLTYYVMTHKKCVAECGISTSRTLIKRSSIESFRISSDPHGLQVSLTFLR